MASNPEVLSIKEKYRNNLLKQLAAAYEQLSSTRNKADIPAIEEQVQQLAEKIKTVESEIDASKRASADENQILQRQVYRDSFNNWEDNLHRIDFSKVTKNLGICQQMEDQEGAALFLLENSQTMGGKWGVKKIRHRLQELGTWYPPLEFVFSQHQTVNPTDFLCAVAQKFDGQMSQAPEPQIIIDLIKKIYSALCGGHVLLIQIEIPYLDAKSTFLDWFIHQFWCPLVRQLPMIGRTSPLVKIFAVITVRGKVDKVCLPEAWCCPRQQFHSEKVLKLPLQKWTEADIRNWLVKFSGLMSPAVGLTRPEIEQLAQSIYQVSAGRPIDVYHELMKTMTDKVS
jgi:inactive STAND/Effector-associated domain 9